MELKHLSIALVRIFGCSGGIILFLGSVYFGDKNFGLKGMELFVVSLFSAITGFAIGAIIGSHIEIRNQNALNILNTFGIFCMNGLFIWTLISSTIFHWAIGIKEIENWVYDFGPFRFYLFLFGIGLFGSLLVSLMSMLGRKMVFSGHESRLPLILLLDIIVGLCTGIVQSIIFDIHIFFGIVIGFLFPLVLIPICSYTITKDELGRKTRFSYK